MRYTQLGFSAFMYAIALKEDKGLFAQRVTANSILVFDLVHDEFGNLFLFDTKKEAEDFIEKNQIKMTLFEDLSRLSIAKEGAGK